MLIEQRLNELNNLSLETPKYVKTQLLEKASLINKKTQRKKFNIKPLYIAISSLIIMLVFGVTLLLPNINSVISVGFDSGIGPGGGGSISFPGFVGMKTNKVSKLNEPVVFEFNYGHYYSTNDFTNETSIELIGHYIEVFVYDGKSGLQKFGEQTYSNYQKLYEKHFQNHDFLDNKYKILNENLWIWSKIKYQKGFDLEIDFSKIVIDSGRIVIKISEITLYKYEENGEILEEQEIANRYEYLNFEKPGLTNMGKLEAVVKFSK